ncbi:MAG TPA: glycosyltransferase family 4 protein [Puia sp.]|nr:glycosyltransferase family 4 protein [Puia sp.]
MIIMITASLPPLPSGGAELQALHLAERLNSKGVSVTFLTPGKGAVRGPATLQGLPVYRFHSIFGRAFEFMSRRKKKGKKGPTIIEYDDKKEVVDRIASKVGWPTVVYYNIFFWHCLLFLWPRRRKVDIIHAHTMEWSAIVAARLGKMLGKPVLIKDSTMNGFASLARFPAGGRLQRIIIGKAHFVAMTAAIRANLLQAGVPAEKISRIPNGIPIPPQHLSEERPGDPPRVLFVGNLYQQPAKGVDILLKAWQEVVREHPTAVLDLVGDGDLPAYREYARSLGIDGTVYFHGRHSELQAYYRTATMFVLPSRREGMSNALMEAMLNGLPCVATDISGNQDLIRSGINGLLVPAADIRALAQAIGYVLAHRDEAILMGQKGRKTILEGLDIDIIANRYIALYKELTAIS